ncbi:YbjN domain-containing protein [Paenibacillus hodogayensis]|uniref:YbjN domain-containing protein n=1 Tax=Paenibacillus hodogayensis TaxID=279208 RepID=A0ABV5W145_9BACL
MADQEAVGSSAQSRLELDHSLAFNTLKGDSLMAVIKRMTLTAPGENALCTLSLEVEWSVYRQMIAEEWMGLLSIARSGETDTLFEENQPIELKVVLRHSLLKTALRKGTEVEQVLQALLEDAAQSGILGQSESWLVTEVKQRVRLPEELDGGGTLKKGYRTLWAEAAAVRVASDEASPGLNQVAERYLDRMDLRYERVDDTILRLSYTGEQGAWIVLVRIDEERQICVVYSVYPDAVPEERRADTAVFLIEENYDLAVGSFELDTTDGELRYRTSIDVEHDRLSMELFGQLFSTNVVVMDHYFNAIKDGIRQGFPE